MPKCKHIQECEQFIASDYLPHCLGELGVGWDQGEQENCFQWNELADETEASHPNTATRWPREWDKVTQ